MSGDERDGDRGRSKAPPPRTGSTLQGMPAVDGVQQAEELTDAEPTRAPPPSESVAPDGSFGRNRVTMDFSGPPLSLPADTDADADAAFGREPERTGWASELDPRQTPEPPRSVSDGPHDAWAIDRKRRSTPPVGLPAVTVEPPRSPMPPVARSVGQSRAWSVPPTLPSAPEQGGALGLVDRARPPSQPTVDLAAEMAERYALDDFTGALRTAELLLGSDPSNAEALRYAQSCRERLVQIYSSRLGPLGHRVEVIVPDREVRWLGLDHRAGFLLSRIDGSHSIEEVIDMSGMHRLEALKTLVDLREAGAIRIRPA